MTCPHCRKPLDPAVIPDEIIASERGRRNAARRLTHSGGRNGGRPPKKRGRRTTGPRKHL